MVKLGFPQLIHQLIHKGSWPGLMGCRLQHLPWIFGVLGVGVTQTGIARKALEEGAPVIQLSTRPTTTTTVFLNLYSSIGGCG